MRAEGKGAPTGTEADDLGAAGERAAGPGAGAGAAGSAQSGEIAGQGGDFDRRAGDGIADGAAGANEVANVAGAGGQPGDRDKIPIVCLGDSITQAAHDGSWRGGHVGRLVEYCDLKHPGRFQFLGTNPVKGHIGVAYSEGHGGLDAQGLLAALENKPVAKVPSGKPMFGPGGWYQNVGLVIYAGGANNCNNYHETTSQTDAAQRALLWRLFEQLNSCPGSKEALVMTMGGYLPWGGIPQNNDKALACSAVWDAMLDDLCSDFPSRVLRGYKWQQALSAHDLDRFADDVHPNALGYDCICETPDSGLGFIEFLAPTLAKLAA